MMQNDAKWYKNLEELLHVGKNEKLKDKITLYVKPSGCYELKVRSGMGKEDNDRTAAIAGENNNRK